MKKKTVIIAAAVLLAAGTVVYAQNDGLNQRKPVIEDRDLVIQIADITENALFYPVDIDGMRMEVLAVKAPDGTIRTAFNTCQVCYSSGKGYFVQTGTVLVCQNCGNRYRMNQVERRAGGCNPVPIFPANKTVTNSTITISREYLQQARGIFASWRRG
jgi:uncharacterized membrane protein